MTQDPLAVGASHLPVHILIQNTALKNGTVVDQGPGLSADILLDERMGVFIFDASLSGKAYMGQKKVGPNGTFHDPGQYFACGGPHRFFFYQEPIPFPHGDPPSVGVAHVVGIELPEKIFVFGFFYTACAEQFAHRSRCLSFA